VVEQKKEKRKKEERVRERGGEGEGREEPTTVAMAATDLPWWSSRGFGRTKNEKINPKKKKTEGIGRR